MLLSSSVYWANHWAHRRRCGGSVKGVEGGLVEAGRAAPSLEACTGCPSPDAVWVSAELHPPLNPRPPSLLWYQCQGLCLRATGLVSHLVSHTDTLLVFVHSLVPEQLGCVLGGYLPGWPAAGTGWGRSAVSSRQVGLWEEQGSGFVA